MLNGPATRPGADAPDTLGQCSPGSPISSDRRPTLTNNRWKDHIAVPTSREAEVSEPSEEELWGELDVAAGPRRGEILLELADRCFQRQDMRQFDTLVDAAAEASASAGDDRLAAYARFNQGQGLMETGEFAAAAASFLQSAAYFHQIGAETDVAMSHQRAGDAYSRCGDSVAALGEWNAALRLFESCDDPVQVGRTWMFIGGEQIAASQLAEAEESFFAARTAFRQAGSASHVAWADDAAAEALIHQDRIDDAAPLLRACLDIVTVGNDPQALGYAALRLGTVVRMLGEAEEALDHLTTAREAFQQADDFSGLGRCDLESARAWRVLGDEDQAEVLFQRARSIFDAVGADALLVQTDQERAQLFLTTGRYREAESTARECQRLAVELGDQETLAEATMVAAVSLLEQESPDAALLTVEAHLGRPTGHDGLNRTQLLTWARVLMANDRHDDAQEILDELAKQTTADSDPSSSAQVRELRWRLHVARAGSQGQPVSVDADLTSAIALYLAAGDTERASDLSRFLIAAPTPPAASQPR